MNKQLKYILLLALGAISVFAGIWYYNKYIKKPTTLPPADDNLPPVSDDPNPNNVFVDSPSSDSGKKAYSKFGNAVLYTKNFNTIRTVPKDELVGTITGQTRLNNEEEFYIIDNEKLVSKILVRVE